MAAVHQHPGHKGEDSQTPAEGSTWQGLLGLDGWDWPKCSPPPWVTGRNKITSPLQKAEKTILCHVHFSFLILLESVYLNARKVPRKPHPLLKARRSAALQKQPVSGHDPSILSHHLTLLICMQLILSSLRCVSMPLTGSSLVQQGFLVYSLVAQVSCTSQ